MDKCTGFSASSPPASAPAVPRALRIVLQLAAAALAAVIALRTWFALTHWSRLSHESGIWTALAMDAAHGVVYRPLLGPEGYGGTRYLPLQFLVHSLLIRAGMEPIHAGLLLLVFSAIVLIAAVVSLLRTLRIPLGVALPVCVLVTGTEAADMALTMIRGDLMAAALNFTGLALCATVLCRAPASEYPIDPRPADRRAWTAQLYLGGGAVLFGLTFLAKITSVFGFVAVAATLLLRGPRAWKQAATFVVIYAAVAAGGLLAMEHLSHGNFVANLRACGSAGGGIRVLLRLPLNLFHVVAVRDTLGMFVILLGVAACGVLPRRQLLQFLPLTFLVTAVVTVSIFTTPGIDRNHLLDVEIMAAILLAAWIATGDAASRKLLPLVLLLTVASLANAVRKLPGDRSDLGDEMIRIARSTTTDPGPILTDFTLFPVLLDRDPYMLDEYMMPVLCAKEPAIHADMDARLDAGFFSAVIFKVDRTRPRELLIWGKDFDAHLDRGYDRAGWMGTFLVYRRKHATPTTQP